MQQIEFRVLGPFEVWVEGRALQLRRRKQRALLALLLLHAGEVVSTDQLIEELWAGKPPEPRSARFRTVSQLRKALGRDVSHPRIPATCSRQRARADRLAPLRAARRRGVEGGDAERRAELLREALGLWRGPPLADLAYESFAALEVARLEELRRPRARS